MRKRWKIIQTKSKTCMKSWSKKKRRRKVKVQVLKAEMIIPWTQESDRTLTGKENYTATECQIQNKRQIGTKNLHHLLLMILTNCNGLSKLKPWWWSRKKGKKLTTKQKEAITGHTTLINLELYFPMSIWSIKSRRRS